MKRLERICLSREAVPKGDDRFLDYPDVRLCFDITKKKIDAAKRCNSLTVTM